MELNNPRCKSGPSSTLFVVWGRSLHFSRPSLSHLYDEESDDQIRDGICKEPKAKASSL